MDLNIRSHYQTCKLKSDTEGLMENNTQIKLKDKFEIEDISNHIIGRAVVTEEKSNLMDGLTNVFSFGSKKEKPKVVIEKNEIKAIIFKRIGKDKFVFNEGT